MPDEGSDRDHESRRRLEELGALMDASRADIDKLQTRADAADRRADASQARADQDHQRIVTVESRLDVDRALIQELQDEGLFSREHAAHLEEALRSSRLIGAAIGIVMAHRRVSEEVAFAMITRASQKANRKLRLLAEDIVHTGDTAGLVDA